MPHDDDDDWTGTPPEGHISRDRARPDYPDSQWQAIVARGLLGVVVLASVLLIVFMANRN